MVTEALFLSVFDELVLYVPDDRAEVAKSALNSEMPTVINGVRITGSAEVLGTAWRK